MVTYQKEYKDSSLFALWQRIFPIIIPLIPYYYTL